MVQALMLCGIGMLAGCLLMLMFFPIVHQRAVRIARQHAVEAVPLAINEIQADKDHLRAQFAMSIRRLEINIEEMRARTAGQKGEIGRQGAEINRLHAELNKKDALIFALRTRDAVRKSIVRRTAKTLLYIYVRSNRNKLKKSAPVAPGVALSFDTSVAASLAPDLGPTLGTSLRTGLGENLAVSEQPSIAGNQT